MDMTLEVRPFVGRAEYEQMVDYFLKGDDAFLHGMGVDRSKLPSREDWIKSALLDHDRANDEKGRAYLAWVLNSELIGHSSVNNIKVGEHAYIHLHVWQAKRRRAGLGAKFVDMSAVRFARDLFLKRLYCEPYALNPGPNHVLRKCQFRFVKRYRTVPGPINFEQEVNHYVRDFDTPSADQSHVRES